MKFESRNNKKMLLFAMIHGAIIGVVGVFLFFIALHYFGGDEESISDVQKKGTNTTANAEIDKKAYTFYAQQYGVFSSEETAKEFLASNPKLYTSAVVSFDDQYYVWSAVATKEKDIKEVLDKESFVKKISLSGAKCESPALIEMPKVLSASKVSKFTFEGAKKKTDSPANWESNIAAVSKVSDDIMVVRLQLMSHYTAQNKCLKIGF
ncbi:hypothetical protein JFL43_00850 [Viridibacillus sp. YIM B01967]|jgi:hypothetical protein|uniref:SPOR domain-containing protein n=1 Tax=Viridibacillus soli TaxID=2798301 RepID=A0ABS1H203_9BACL|nr:hypothetical protein [Viridibacillus soli]MBK3493438.1 hypothetical protein [Viridibacillus soli]